jgi:hypothetical protein
MPQDWFAENAPGALRTPLSTRAEEPVRLAPSHTPTTPSRAQAPDWFSANAPTSTKLKPPAEDADDEDWFSYIGNAAKDTAIGAAKSLAAQGVRGGALLRKIPGVNYLDKLMEPIDVDITPDNPAQARGGTAFEIAQAVAPGGAITKLGTKAANLAGPVVGRLLPRAGVEAAAAGGLAALQGQDVTTAAGVAGALPFAGAALSRGAGKLFPGSRLSPEAAAAVQFGEQRGIPIDAATATGRPIVATMQKRVSDSIGGAGVAERVRGAQEAGLARVGQELADASNATLVAPRGAAMDAVSAGEGIRGGVLGKVKELQQQADEAYGTLRGIEADPRFAKPVQVGKDALGKPVMETIALPVDLRNVKDALKPTYDRLAREKQLNGVLMGDKAKAMVALDTLISGPDAAPLSIVDAALGDLKTFARADIPELRSIGQGVAAGAVKRLDAVVRQTAEQAGPKAIQALEAGRKATTAKHVVGDLLESLSEEPGKVFQQLTANRDTALKRVQAVKDAAPEELPNVGRAYLQGLLDKATGEGGFKRADGLWADWQRMGPQTKEALFGPQVGELNNFFLLAKKIAENPNPSGTGRVTTAFNLMSTVPSWAIAQVLYSKAGAQMLSKSLRTGDPGEITRTFGRVVANRAGAAAADEPTFLPSHDPGGRR